MGKGKGAIEKWSIVIKRGRILIQLKKGIKAEVAFNCLRQVKYRLPFKSKIICRNVEDKKTICKFYKVSQKKF